MPTIGFLIEGDAIRIAAGLVGRFYHEGLLWALRLPLPELINWNQLIPRIERAEHGR